jgi:M6 family metalloprotease-like protein
MLGKNSFFLPVFTADYPNFAATYNSCEAVMCKNEKGEKKMIFKKHFLIISLLAIIMLFVISASVLAVTASPDPFPFTQPNGIVIAVRQFGDEFLHWSEDVNGNLIVFDEDKEGFCYATWTDAGAVSSGELAGMGLSMVMFRPAGQEHIIPQSVLKRAAEMREKEQAFLSETQPVAGALAAALTASAGTHPVYTPVERMKRKMLMIYATWEDRSTILTASGQVMPELTGKQIYDICFGLREEVDRSVNGYYQELLMADEAVILPAEVLVPMDGYQGVVKVVMPGQHTNPASDDPSSIALMNAIITKVCAENLVDLSKFDTDGNGNLATAELAIGMIVDGFEYSVGRLYPNFWGFSIGTTPAASITHGVKIASLFAQGAFHRNSGNCESDMLTTGIIAHEMGHSGYSFHDTYDTGNLNASSGGHGYWSLMSSGSHGRKPGESDGKTPGYPDAYNLVRSGFVLPGVVNYGESAVMNNHLDIYIAQTPITTPTQSAPATHPYGTVYGGQFFLLQRRAFGVKDNYDQAALGFMNTNANAGHGGLLLFHVDMAVPNNRIYNKPGHYRAAIEEAHGDIQSLQQRSGQPGRNSGDLGDLWGVNQFEFSHRSDSGSGLYMYENGSNWINALTPIPNQDTPSGITVTDILWDPETLTTTFSMGYKIEVNFPGVEDVTVQYYCPDTSWQTVAGSFSDPCAVYPPEGANITSVRAAKGGMSYQFDGLKVGGEHLFLDVPVETITIAGIDAECNLAITQSDWVYPYAPTNGYATNHFNVFANGKKYEIRLYRPGFYPIVVAGLNADQTVFFGPSYFYQTTVPSGVTHVWISSYDWAARDANAGDIIPLLRDYSGTIRNAKLSYVYGGQTYNEEIILDGSDPFANLRRGITVTFPGIEQAEVRYYTNVCGWQSVGVFNDSCQFAIPAEQRATWGATTVQVLKGGMWYTFGNLAVGDDSLVLALPLKKITLTGINAACELGLAQEDWIYSSAPAAAGQTIEYLVFDNNKKYMVHLNKAALPTIRIMDITAGALLDLAEYF